MGKQEGWFQDLFSLCVLCMCEFRLATSLPHELHRRKSRRTSRPAFLGLEVAEGATKSPYEIKRRTFLEVYSSDKCVLHMVLCKRMIVYFQPVVACFFPPAIHVHVWLSCTLSAHDILKCDHANKQFFPSTTFPVTHLCVPARLA